MVSTKGLMALTVVFTAMIIVTVLARLWARHEKRLNLWVDDICAITAAVLFVIVFTVPVLISCVSDNLGAHVPTTTSGRPLPPSKTFNATRFTYLTFHVLPLGVAKCSILFLYKRIFRGKVFTVVTWTVIGLVLAWMIGFFLVLLLQCIPVTVSPVDHPGLKCINIVPVTWALGTSGVITDFIIMVIPWPFIWQLQIPTRQKFAVTGMFLLGALTIAASLARCIVLFTIARHINRYDIDYTYYDGENMVWALTECALAIISSCLPTLGRLLRGWTMKLDLRAWTRSFRFRSAAGPHGADQGKDSNSSYINLRDLSSKDIAQNASKTSTTATHEQDMKLSTPDNPMEGILVSNTFGRGDCIV